MENRFFGESVTVTGLVTGRDIVSALQGRDTGTLVVIPDVMLKEGEGVFLDDLSVRDLEDALKVTVGASSQRAPSHGTRRRAPDRQDSRHERPA